VAKLPTASKIKRLIVNTQKGQVYIFFGSDPSSQAPFEAAAWYLHKRLSRIYKNSKVGVNSPQNIDSSGKLVKFLLKDRNKDEEKIKEIHFFSHAWSHGLSLNYGGTPGNQELKDLEDIYGSLVRQNIGGDDSNQFNPIQLRFSNLQYLSEAQIKKLRASFSSGAIARFWGCNTGFGDGDTNPYTNIAETFAQYANIESYGAPKGTNFYAFVNKKWTTKHAPVGKKAPWPFELRPYRYPKSKQSSKFANTETLSKLVKKKLVPKTPYVKYLDQNLDEIKADPTSPEVFKLKAGTIIMFLFGDFEYSDLKVSIYSKAGIQVNVDKLMNVSPHSEWSVSSDKKQIILKKGRTEFLATIHNMPILSNNGISGKEYYCKVNYTGHAGAKVFEGKKQRFTFY
jgi:hypothetical protein